MFCTNCGHQLDGNFCGHCGNQRLPPNTKTNPEQNKSPVQSRGGILFWASLFIFCIFKGFTNILDSQLVMTIWFGLALIVTPFGANLVAKLTGLRMNKLVLLIIVVSAWYGLNHLTVSSIQDEARMQVAIREREKLALMVELEATKKNLIPHLRSLLATQQYDVILSKAKKYAGLDKEISTLVYSAEALEAKKTAEAYLAKNDTIAAWFTIEKFAENENIQTFANELKRKFLEVKRTEILQTIAGTAPNDYLSRINLYRELNKLFPTNKKYEAELQKALSTKIRQNAEIKLLTWSWQVNQGWVTAEGRIRNLKQQPLKNIQAVISYFDDKKNFITADSALIEYNPLMPGQTSPFKVLTNLNPLMHSAQIEFSYLGGGTIPHYSEK
jgi:hypothetical protein